MTVEPRRRARLRIEALAVLAAFSAGCGTTTVGGGNSPRWLAEHRGDYATATTDGPEGPVEWHNVRIVSTSPTEVQLRSDSGEVVPVEHLRAIRVSKPGYAMTGGAAIGLVVGLAGGIGVMRKPDPPDCDTCAGKPMAAALLVSSGIIFGMLIGLAAGHTDVLTF